MSQNNVHAKIMVVDDDPDFLDLMQHFLQKAGIERIMTVDSYDRAKALLTTFHPDLVLLDFNLEGNKNGADLGHVVREILPDAAIIFFTNNFTDDVFEAVKAIHPSAFLDKQLNELKVRQAIELALESSGDTIAVFNKKRSINYYFGHEFVFVKMGSAFKKIQIDEIDYIFYADRYANVQVDGKTYPLNMTLKELATNLSSGTFIQIHQSYIVNFKRINQISTVDNQVEVAGKWLPIGVSYRKGLQEKLIFLT